MSHQDLQPPERGPRWLGYIMLTGVLCIVGSLLIRSVFGPKSGYNDVVTGIGYVGLILVLVGFLISVMVE